VHAAVAIPLTLLLAALVMLGTASLGTELWWLVAAVIALTVAVDAWLSRLSRFPSRFPLHPAGACMATFMIWPVSLPWYLHTKWRIRTGRLREDSPPRGQGCTYTVMTVMALGVFWAGVVSIGNRPALRDLQTVARALQPLSPAPFEISVSNGSNLVITIDGVPAMRADSLRALARHLASVAYFSFRDSSRINAVAVTFRTVTSNGMVTLTCGGPSFEWWNNELDTARGRSRAVVPN
jgi:hypothetical protein